jgi:membrane-bound lytic murein transglycosylase B
VTRLWVVSLALAASLQGFTANAKPSGYAERAEVQGFIREVAARHGFQEEALRSLFSRVQRVDPILEAIKPTPPRARSWTQYRGIFVNERRIAAGLDFWSRHRADLERARQQYGVPPEYIVAIIGVETFYGRHAGRWRVLDALTTLAFDYPPRATYFRSELEHYLVLTRDIGAEVLSIRGSFAGAIGIAQFMPSSTRRYAVDFDGDGLIDLRNSPVDAIGSVANFLKQHGWQPGGEVLLEATASGDAWRSLADGGVQPKHALAELREAGLRFQWSGQGARAALIELQTPERPSDLRLGMQNFWVLTRYNRSAFYASAVHDLAQALRNGQDPGK